MLFAPILRSAAGKSRNVCGIASKEKRASFVSRAMCMLVLAHLLAANLISASCSSIAPAPTPFPFLPSVICRTPQEHKEQSIHRAINIREKRARAARFARQTLLPFIIPLSSPSLSPTPNGPSPAFIPPFTNREKSRQSRSSEQEQEEEKAPRSAAQ